MNDPPLNGHAPNGHAHAPKQLASDALPESAPERGSGIRALTRVDRRAVASPPPATADEVRAAVARARTAQYEWHLRPFAERADALRRAAREMLRRRAELVALARDEVGKSDVEALFLEALGPLDAVRTWVRLVERATRRQRVRLNPVSFAGKQAYVDLVARGVVGIIAPWNFPVSGLYRSTIPALLTGNAIVVKPSEWSPRTSGWYVERLAEALPQGLVHVVQGDGRAGAALIDAGVDACVFTGSPETGRAVQVRCAQRGIPCSAEMGGKDPAIVLADCDLERTVAGLTHWALSNAGQACAAIEIAYVDERIADAVVRALGDAWSRLRAGTDRFADVAPLANRRQLDTVVSHIDDARAKGAVVVCGGAALGEGLVFPPTLLDRCDSGMKVVDCETFGPVLAVVRVAGAAEAIRRTNASRYGLGASIWTRDVARAKRLAERLSVGVVTINNHAISGGIPDLPQSGTRDTGTGIANSVHSLGTFVRPRATVIDGSKRPEIYWMPYEEALYALGDIVAGLQIGEIARAWRLPWLVGRRLATLRSFFTQR